MVFAISNYKTLPVCAFLNMKFVNCRQGPLYNSVKSQGHIQYCTVYNTVKPFFQSDGEEEIETETEDTEFGKSNFLKVFRFF